MNGKQSAKRGGRELQRSLVEALAIALGAGTLGMVAFFFHPNPIPLIATDAYETMVPCPVAGGEVAPLDAKEINADGHLFVVDARDEDAFSQWHYPGAVRLTYDFLDPIPPAELHSLTKAIAAKRATRVLVYGDGDTPDTGELLGKDISSHGIKNVYFLKGGAEALRTSGKGGQP